MKSITRFALWFALNLAFAASAYFGYIENNENAKNVMQFLVFFVTLPISLIVLTAAKQIIAEAKAKGYIIGTHACKLNGCTAYRVVTPRGSKLSPTNPHRVYLAAEIGAEPLGYPL